ncbi:adhesive plaque matrix protein-like [Bicyclus anynana]|uniref:Adhesive plaque matrix protein-like n=1 Tax=Bicyclus anynana TaxID=110368 RepID=A0A6J1MJG8_BICAN|nr:adhesive plaque matrix protein-like [Bicyclus anynana]
MQLTDVFCYVLLMITTISMYVDAENENGLSENKTEKRISKREAAIYIDTFPVEPMYQQRPRVIYRRISKQRYHSPKPKYGPPPTKYRSSKPWKPSKKYRRTTKPKYGPPSYKRYPKPKYGPPKTKTHKVVYGPPKKVPLNSFYPPEPISFGEPPTGNEEYQTPNQSFGEPPTDSYGEPIKDLYIPEDFPQATNFPDTFVNFNDFNTNFNYKSWQNYQSDQNHNIDSNVAYSKKRPMYVKPDPSFVAQDEDFDLTPAYSHRYKQREVFTDLEPLPFEKKISLRNVNKRIKIKPHRPPKLNDPESEAEEVLVGGRNAEPPERYVPKLTISKYSDDNDFMPLKGYIDPDIALSATMSPYVNYKNTNMAFSPQNLNDAFSIVDK